MATTFTVPDGRVAMAATTYTGTGATQAVSNAINGVGFQPDFVWSKSRNAAQNHREQDSVRGLGAELYPNLTNAEGTGTPGTLGIVSFNATGYSVGDVGTNTNGNTYVGWQWKAGDTTVTNGVGTISSQVRANTTAGFSVVTYTGNGTAGGSVGHGLGVTPGFIIFKSRDATQEWRVWLTSFGTGNALTLNSTSGTASNSAVMNAAPSSTVFTMLGTGYNVNSSGVAYVAYCWAPVAGYSAFGSYTGNGSNDGPFIYTGFRPRWILLKNTSVGTAGYDWELVDTSRSTYNVVNAELVANLSNIESSSWNAVDILSNGFKLRDLGAAQNGSGNTMIYAAFAENPLKFSNAR